MSKKEPTREDIVRAWKKLDAKSGKPLGAPAVAKAMGISQHWITKRFPGGGLTDMKRQHGIRLSPQEIHRSADELLVELDRVVSKYKRIPPWSILIMPIKPRPLAV